MNTSQSKLSKLATSASARKSPKANRVRFTLASDWPKGNLFFVWLVTIGNQINFKYTQSIFFQIGYSRKTWRHLKSFFKKLQGWSFPGDVMEMGFFLVGVICQLYLITCYCVFSLKKEPWKNCCNTTAEKTMPASWSWWREYHQQQLSLFGKRRGHPHLQAVKLLHKQIVFHNYGAW